jgi:hypothetical protein
MQIWRPTAARTFFEGREGYCSYRNSGLSPRSQRHQRAGSVKGPTHESQAGEPCGGRDCPAHDGPQIPDSGAAAIASAPLPVRLRARSGPRPRPDVNAQETRRIEAEEERTARACDAAARVDRLLVALGEVPPVDAAARARLARLLDRHGAQHVILLVRTIIESEGNANALIEPIISAVSSVMVFHPEWANRGLAWIEAFDNVPLTGLLQTMRDLELFRPTTIRALPISGIEASAGEGVRAAGGAEGQAAAQGLYLQTAS